MQLAATSEGVIVLTNPETGEPVAIVRKNGHVQWFTLKEASWGDFENLLEVRGIAN